jgi:hypothetical protein
MRSLRGFLFLIFTLIFLSKGYASNQTSNQTADVKGTAKSLFDTINTKVGKPDKLRDVLVNPLLGQSVMSNIAGNQTFNATVSCPSSQKFLEIIMQPTQSGDTNFFIYYDGNFDRTIDSSLSVNGVSGLCGNGFIICDSGTWNNCRFYQLNYDGQFLSYKQTDFSNLSSCFCINSYCGNNLAWRNKDYVLSVFGGAVVGAFQKAKPQLAISKTQVQDVVIRYYGQDSKSCTISNEGAQGISDPVYFYDNPYNMVNVAKNMQASSPFTKMFTNYLENRMDRTCFIRRVINEVKYDFTQLMASSTSPQCPGISGVGICGENCIYFQMPIYIQAGGAYSTTLTFDANPDVKEKLSSAQIRWCTDTKGPYPCTDDDGWYNFYLNGQLFASGGYGDCEPCWHAVSIPINQLVIGQNTISGTIGGAGGEKGVLAGCRILWVYLYFNSPLKGCYITDNYVEDNCVSLRQKAKDGECSLKQRVQNGVITIKEYHNTGLQPLIECYEICGETFCYNDWTIEETYSCKTTFDNFDMTRPQQVLSTMNYTGGVLSFNDIRLEKGSWKDYPNQSLAINLDTGEACPKVCKVKIPEIEEEIGQLGNEGRFNITRPINIRYEFRECKDNTICEYDTSLGEEKVSDCACLNDFNEALASLQVLRMIGQDLICSSGVERSF